MQVLTPDQVDHFLSRGFITIPGCFTRDFARPFIDHAYERMGCDPNDPTTWTDPIRYLDHAHRFAVSDLCPKAWGAICDVLGGEDRINPTVRRMETIHFSSVESFNWSDAFIVNFRYGADAPWQPPAPDTARWHQDGSFFRHFLDSPEQALLVVLQWTDTPPRSGGTFVACDSFIHVARFLASHPKGVDPGTTGALVEKCRDFIELTGQTGDLTLLHPFTLHASSPNPSGHPRFMTNPPVSLKAPLDFNRADPADFSLIERGVLRALGVDRYDFQPSAPREWYGL
jgi:hypothetical protein